MIRRPYKGNRLVLKASPIACHSRSLWRGISTIDVLDSDDTRVQDGLCLDKVSLFHIFLKNKTVRKGSNLLFSSELHSCNIYLHLELL